MKKDKVDNWCICGGTGIIYEEGWGMHELACPICNYPAKKYKEKKSVERLLTEKENKYEMIMILAKQSGFTDKQADFLRYMWDFLK